MKSETIVHPTRGIVRTRGKVFFGKYRPTSGKGMCPRRTLREVDDQIFTTSNVGNPASAAVAAYRTWQEYGGRGEVESLRALLRDHRTIEMVRDGLTALRPTEKLDLDGRTITIRDMVNAAQPPLPKNTITVRPESD